MPKSLPVHYLTETACADAAASYSADLICETRSRIRKPFRWRDALWVCVGLCGTEVRAYRLTPAASFASPITSYSEKLNADRGDSARNDPQGFYHGMGVTHAGADFVLTGPVIMLTGSGEPEQGNLFAEVA